jgi:predicted ATPase/transcriptional regulator with XRE-family HTH domain
MLTDNSHHPSTFIRWLKSLRAQNDLTQEALAEQVGCSVQTIRFFESGKRRPSREMAARLAEVLQLAGEEHETFVQLARAASTAEPGWEKVLATPAPPPQNPVPQPSVRLPLPATALIGRQRECNDLARLLVEEGCRLVSLVGPGGMGKSRLALHMAHALAAHFRQGAVFVPLAFVDNPADLPSAIARAMNVTMPGESTPLAQLDVLLAEHSLLLVLDNFEHLLQSDESMEATLLLDHVVQQMEGVHLLITSRERLRIAGEHVFELNGLAMPATDDADVAHNEAVMLFLQRARQVLPDFALTPDNRAAVVRICTLLEGMPLGIELAAAWVRTLGAGEIATQIEESLDFLALADRNAPPRHRGLRAVFDHSWRLTTPQEQQVLPHLAVFQGGFDRIAAQEIAGARLPLLASLIDKSFIRVVTNASDETGGLRYFMHELLRQYLLDKLAETGAETGAEAEARRRHALFFIAQIERIQPPVHGDSSPAWRQQVARELGNLHAALEWSLIKGGDPALGLRLAGSLGRFWSSSNAWKEGRYWLQMALANGNDAGALRAQALVRLGILHHLLAELSPAERCLQEALALWRQLQDAPSLAWTLFELGKLASTRGDYGEAEEHLGASLAIYRELGDHQGIAILLCQLGGVAIHRGDYAYAAALLEESLPMAQALQAPGMTALAANMLGRALLVQGNVGQAVELFQQALQIFRQLDRLTGIAWSLLNLGLAHVQVGSFAAAAVEFRACLSIYQELESKGGMMAALEGLATVAAAEGSFARAVPLLVSAERLHYEGGQMLTLYELEMHQRTRDVVRAALGEETWTAVWAAGANLSLVEAIDRALSQELSEPQ